MQLDLAREVIAGSDREHPADSVLRAKLKAARQLAPADASAIARAVFAFYRWRGWIDLNQPLDAQLSQALGLADTFEKNVLPFSDDELLARAVPAWAPGALKPEPGWARSLQMEPALWLRARPGQGRGVVRALGRCVRFGDGPLADALRYEGDKDLFCTPEFQEGQFELQDLSSQAVGLICAPKPGETWWDVCAGEGGKMLHLSDLMQNRGLIRASDRAEWRLRKLKRRAARARVFNYRLAPWDGGERLPTKTMFDGVLVDAPCTGIGTWQRNPHARWTTVPRDVKELADLQGHLLARAARAVKPGGKLVYSVCTLADAETTDIATEFLTRVPGFGPLPFVNPLVPGSTAAPQLFIWPQYHNCNGMFIAAWRREG
jgi:16S rRNA (cytosine967-C5)-methyltransferase